MTRAALDKDDRDALIADLRERRAWQRDHGHPRDLDVPRRASVTPLSEPPLDEADRDALIADLRQRRTWQRDHGDERSVAPRSSVALVAPSPQRLPVAVPSEPTEPEAPASVPRGLLVVISLTLVLVVLVQRWGLITHDTRLDLLFDPEGFLSATWNLWDASADMGRIQNQAVGYLFPMGPFMLLGSLLHLPPWVVERAWIALLLVVAVWGTARLLDALRIGSVTARVVGALAYGLAPFFIARVGNTSVLVQGAAFMPWMLLPLVRGSRSGSPRRAAALSGIAVLFMGGVNAVVVGAALVPGGLWLLTRQRGPRRAALTRWWLLAVVTATAWWAVPLAYQGRFGIDFLAFTETAETTTAAAPPFEVLRGLADWLSNVRLQGVALIAGNIEATAGLVIAGGALVVAVGLYGLCRREVPERRFLVLTLLCGVVLVGAGYGGTLGNPLGGEVVDLLNGPLGLFRNLYKFAPVVLLPVAVGVVSGVDGLVALVRRWAPLARRGAPLARKGVLVGVTGLVLLGAWPLLGGDLLHHQGFAQEPAWWVAAKAYVEQVPGRSLILPGLPLTGSTWGYTAEEPFEWGTSAEWASRQIAPLGSPGATRVLDTVEAVVEQGGSPELAGYLRRAGFSTVVVRNDGDWQSSGAPPPDKVTAAVQASGLERVAGFGPSFAIEIYRVPGTDELSPVSTTPVSATAVVSGDAGTPLAFSGTELEDASVVMAADLAAGDPQPPRWLVTDGNQRTYTDFGANRDNRSYVLTPDEPAPGGGDASRGFLPSDRLEDQTVAVRSGVTAVTSSSYGSWLTSLPEVGPQQAIDGDPSTAWAAAPGLYPDRQWIRLQLGEPADITQLRVTLLQDGSWRPDVHALEVSTEAGSVVSEVTPDESEQVVAVPEGTTSWIRIRFADVDEGDATTGPGLREIEIPGVGIDQRLAVPDQLGAEFADPGTIAPSYLFRRSTSDPQSLLRHDSETQLRRAWEAPRSAPMTPTVEVSAVAGPGLVEMAGTSTRFRITASSTLGDLPGFSPRSLVDGDPQTLWVAGAPPEKDVEGLPANPDRTDGQEGPTAPSADRDPDPTILLEWDGATTIDRIRLDTVDRYSQPRSVRIVNERGEVREATVGPRGLVRFDPLSVQAMWVSFPQVSRYVVEQGGGQRTERPLALAGITVPDRETPAVGLDSRVVATCGSGPSVVIDGQVHELSIDTTMGSVLGMGAIPATPCDDSPVSIDAGSHTLDTLSSDDGVFVVRSVGLDPVDDGTSGPPARTVAVESWSGERRAVRVGPGEESYLAVSENENAGWRATLDGQELRSVKLDGWKQGFVVPAGEGGLVTMTYAPTGGYRVALVAGALLVFGLMAMALVGARRAPPPSVAEGRIPWWLLVAATVVAGIALGGPLVLLVLPVFVLGRWRAASLGVLAGGSFALAAILVAWSRTGGHPAVIGSTGWVPTTLTVLALLAVAVSVVLPSVARRGSSDPDASAPDLNIQGETP